MIKRMVRNWVGDERYVMWAQKKTDCRRRLYEFFGCGKYSKQGLGGLTEKLNKYLNFKNGTFIEVGANNGIDQSNTYYLERLLGWHGYLIEAVPELSQRCEKNRKKSMVFNCALVAPENHGTKIKIVYDKGSRGLMSKIGDDGGGDVVEVTGRTLTDVLDEGDASTIDFFSLDVEGFEVEVLKGLDLNKYRPTYILVETGQLEEVDDMLSKSYTRIDQLSFHDYLYRANHYCPVKNPGK